MGVLIAVDEAAAGVSECLTVWNGGEVGKVEEGGLTKKMPVKRGVRGPSLLSSLLFSPGLIDG